VCGAHAYINMCVYNTYMHTCIHMYRSYVTCIHTFIRNIHTCIRNIRTCVTYIHTFIHAQHTYTYNATYIHAYVHTYIHAQEIDERTDMIERQDWEALDNYMKAINSNMSKLSEDVVSALRSKASFARVFAARKNKTIGRTGSINSNINEDDDIYH
jgi:hypothetical protein